MFHCHHIPAETAALAPAEGSDQAEGSDPEEVSILEGVADPMAGKKEEGG